MKYVISINQKAAQEVFGDALDIIDLALLDVLSTAAHARGATKKFVGATVYWHVSYKEMIRQLPTTGIKTPDGMARRVAKLKDAGAIVGHPDNKATGICFWTFGPKMQPYYSAQVQQAQQATFVQPPAPQVEPATAQVKIKAGHASWIKEYATEFDRVLEINGHEKINWKVMADREFSMIKKLREEAIKPDLKKKLAKNPEDDQLFASFSALVKLAMEYFKQVSKSDGAPITPTTVYRVYNTLKNFKPKQQPKQQLATHGDRKPGESDIQYMRRTMYQNDER